MTFEEFFKSQDLIRSSANCDGFIASPDLDPGQSTILCRNNKSGDDIIVVCSILRFLSSMVQIEIKNMKVFANDKYIFVEKEVDPFILKSIVHLTITIRQMIESMASSNVSYLSGQMLMEPIENGYTERN